MKIIDGHTGEYHITSQQIADSNMAIFGDGDYVFDIGNKFALDVVSASEVMLNDGVLIMQGRRAITPAGERTALSIANGAQGVQRNDIIIARYTIDSGDIESVDFAIVQGVNDGEDPEITTGNIRNGASLHEMPMYRVRLDGINITGVDTLFKGVSKIREILDGLSKKYIIDHISQSGWEIDKYNDGTWEGWIKGTTAAIQFTSATALGTNVYQMRNAANAIKIPALPIGYVPKFTLPNLAVSGMASSVTAYTSPSSGGFGDMYVTYQASTNTAASQTVQYAIFCIGTWS